MTRYVSTAEVLEDIRAVADELGRTPLLSEFIRHGEYSENLVYRDFDSWRDATAAAGLDPGQSSDIAREDYLADVQRVADTLGRPPTQSEYDAHGTYSASKGYTDWGAWDAVIEAAGLDPSAMRFANSSSTLERMSPEDLGLSPQGDVPNP